MGANFGIRGLNTSVKRLYVIKHELGPVKIGISENPEQRLEEIQRFCPYRLELESVFKAKDPHRHEAHLHSELSHRKVRGEWFDLPPRLERDLIQTGLVGTERPIQPLQPNIESRKEANLKESALR